METQVYQTIFFMVTSKLGNNSISINFNYTQENTKSEPPVMLNKIYRCIRIAQSSDIHLVFSVTSSQLLHFIIFIMCNPLLSPVPAGVVILTLLHLRLYCEFLSPPSQCIPPCPWMLLNCIC